MAGNRNLKGGRSRAGTGEGAEPRARLRLPLRNLDDVKAELARLYREGKSGRRDVTEVSKLANVLGILGRQIEGADVERRVEELEARARKTK